MDLQNSQNRSMHLVLSTDAKPRLKWTPELHQRFLDAINHLGGANKATPKSLLRVMGIPGLTLYHLKSHLQKFRLGKNQQLDICSDNKHEDHREIQSSVSHCKREICVGTHNQMTDLQIAQALQMQMEVQGKLYEQLEVQRHLQLRIEAQGKYLQSVLKKAQETLVAYSSSSTSNTQLAKAELSRLVSVINNACPSSPISELTETRGLSSKDGKRKQSRGIMCSLESSLTSSESSRIKEDKKRPKDETRDLQKSNSTSSVELPLIAIRSADEALNGDASDESSGRKRSGGANYDGETCANKERKIGLSELLDLNRQYQSDIDSNSKVIDLNQC
ncbi:myb family transcription factor PHL8-like [Neltuma alba]|uniref:myb family transcription factor PHL8-like n=1 Tax=Neltuma alba TaxID=207710 RepID=UPI0010A43068|nr:myb family transcription factor PHL8-like [Prosopis alba]